MFGTRRPQASSAPVPAPAPAAARKPAAPASSTKQQKSKAAGLDFDFEPKEINIEDLENDNELLGELAALGWQREQPPLPPVKAAAAAAAAAAAGGGGGVGVEAGSRGGNSKLYAIPTAADLGLDDEFDDSNIQLDEADMNDPELLSQLQQFGMGEDVEDGDAEDSNGGGGGGGGGDDDGGGHVFPKGNQPETFNHKTTNDLIDLDDYFDSSPAVSAYPQHHQPPAAAQHDPTLQPAVSLSSAGAPLEAAAEPPPMTAAEAKSIALKLKREGKDQEAVRWLRKAKMIEMGGSGVSPGGLGAEAAIAKRPTSVRVPVAPVAPAVSAPARAPVAAASSSGQKPSAPAQARPQPVPAPAAAAAPAGGAVYAVDQYQPNPAISRAFDLLSDTIKTAQNATLTEAKRLKAAGDNKAALECMRQYKAYGQELDVVEARRAIPGQMPALFQWQTVRKETKVENTEVGLDEIKVTVGSAEGLDLSGSSVSVKLTYDLGMPKDTPHTATISGTIDRTTPGKVNFDFSTKLTSGIKRSSQKNILTLAYQRKKAVFNLKLKRGLVFKENIEMGTAVVNLGDLLTKSRCGGNIRLTKENDKGRPKEVGGSLSVELMLRSPILGPEVNVVEERVLVVGAWPDPVAVLPQPVAAPAAVVLPPSPPSAAPALAPAPAPQAAAAPSLAPAPAPQAAVAPQRAPAAAPAPAVDQFTDLTANEKNDPCGVEWMVSNDVLDAELASAQAAVQACKDADQRLFLTIRVQIISTKLSLLVQAVQEEKLSMEEYLAVLKERIARDIRLVKFLALDPDRVAEAVQVKNRIKLMLQEVEGAEAAGGGEEEEGV